MSIGERISELRARENITQGELARVMGVSRQAVSKWETDQSSPDTLNLIRLAEVLDTDIEYLATGRNSHLRRPPVVIKSIETVEKIVEKPVIEVVEKIVEKPVVEYVDKPVIKEIPVVKKIVRTRYRRNLIEYFILGFICFIFGFFLGLII